MSNRGDREINRGDNYNRERNVDRSQRTYSSRDNPREGQRDSRPAPPPRRDSRDSRDSRDGASNPDESEPRLPKLQPDVKPVSANAPATANARSTFLGRHTILTELEQIISHSRNCKCQMPTKFSMTTHLSRMVYTEALT